MAAKRRLPELGPGEAVLARPGQGGLKEYVRLGCYVSLLFPTALPVRVKQEVILLVPALPAKPGGTRDLLIHIIQQREQNSMICCNGHR